MNARGPEAEGGVANTDSSIRFAIGAGGGCILTDAMAKATWEGAVLAESDRCVEVEGNLYFPKESIDCRYFKASDTHTVCARKGTASYYHVKVKDKLNPDAAWYYPNPRPAAARIREYIAFWKGVKVER